MASRQVKINVVAIALIAAAVGVVTNYATDQVPEFFQDQSRVWLVFGVLVLLGVVVQLVTNRERTERTAVIGKVWNVPGRNPHFTGRDKDLKELRRLLKARSRVAVHAVRGMGGVGKTQLALEFCHRHCTRLDAVWWIEAENPTLIPDQLLGLGRALGLDLPADAPDAVGIVLAHLRSVRRWLLVFDNAESVTDLHPFLPSDAGSVLITTRRAGFDAIGGLLHVDTMARRESLALLARRAPNLSSAQADELAQLLGDLPLGLEQAAAYLDQSRIPPHEYLELLRSDPDGLSGKGEDRQRRTPDRSLDKLWTLSLQRLDEHHPSAAQLLSICAYLAPEAIPLELFIGSDAPLPPPLESEARSAAGVSHAVGILADYSLVKRDGNTLTIHRLVQLAARGHASSVVQGDEWHALACAINLLSEYLPSGVNVIPETWPTWRRLLPHALTALNHHEQRQELVPEQASLLLDRTGSYLQSTGLAGQALPLLERAVAIVETAGRLDEARLTASLSNLASVLHDLGRPAQAKPLLERAIAISESIHGPNHPEVAVALSNLAVVLHDLGQPAAGMPLLERALTIAESADGADQNPDIAIRLSNLAAALQDLDRPAEATPLLERALAIDETTLGPSHPNVAIRLNNLAMALYDLGQFTEARPLAERALTIDETAYGPNHPTVAVSLNNLAVIVQGLGLPVQAKPLFERALTITEAAYGPHHPKVAIRLSNLAMALDDLGLSAQAKPLLERAVTISETTYGPDHPNVEIGLNNLAVVLDHLGRPTEADLVQQRVAQMRAVR